MFCGSDVCQQVFLTIPLSVSHVLIIVTTTLISTNVHELVSGFVNEWAPNYSIGYLYGKRYTCVVLIFPE